MGEKINLVFPLPLNHFPPPPGHLSRRPLSLSFGCSAFHLSESEEPVVDDAAAMNGANADDDDGVKMTNDGLPPPNN